MLHNCVPEVRGTLKSPPYPVHPPPLDVKVSTPRRRRFGSSILGRLDIAIWTSW